MDDTPHVVPGERIAADCLPGELAEKWGQVRYEQDVGVRQVARQVAELPGRPVYRGRPDRPAGVEADREQAGQVPDRRRMMQQGNECKGSRPSPTHLKR